MFSLEEELTLRSKLRALARQSPRQAGEPMEARLRAAYRARRKAQRRKNRMLACYGALVLAASLLVIALLRNHHSARRTAWPTSLPENRFVALPYGQSEVPLEESVVVRVNLEPAQLRALGMPLPADSTSPRRADLLIGQDGMARAIRLVDSTEQ